jgi:Fe-S-cluster containining protein
LFADVKLQPKDDVNHLLSLGIPVEVQTAKRKAQTSRGQEAGRFVQPCAAFEGCRCRIYASRPDYCRRFECLLLKKLHDGTVTRPVAERLIRRARRSTAAVEKLLRALGQTDAIGLADRFRSLTQRLEQQPLDPKSAELYGKLTLAFHELNMVLHEHFYSLPTH